MKTLTDEKVSDLMFTKNFQKFQSEARHAAEAFTKNFQMTDQQRPLTNEACFSRPPIGIEPEFIWKTKRLHELVLAAGRFIDAGRDVDCRWYLEIRTLIDDLNFTQEEN